MTKQGVKGKYQITLNEKYEMYLNSTRSTIITNTQTKSTNYKTVQVIYYHLDSGGTITVYCNPLGTLSYYCHPKGTPGFFPPSSKVKTHQYEYYVVKIGYDAIMKINGKGGV